MRLCTIMWLQVVLSGGLVGSAEQGPDPNALVDGYGSCNKKFQTLSYEVETVAQGETEEQGKRVYQIKYCSRDQEKQWIGHLTQYNKDGTVNQVNSVDLIDICGDKMAVHFSFNDLGLKGPHPPSARLTRDARDRWLQDYVEHPPYGGSLAGHIPGNSGQSIADLLKGAAHLRSEKEATKIIGYDAWRIEGDTLCGTVRGWISPQLGGNCLKWDLVKRRGQNFKDGQFIGELSCKTTFDAERVESIDGQYVVTQARLNYRAEAGKTVLANSTWHFSLKDIDLSPDYEALGAFKIQLPEGTVVSQDHPSAWYRWVGGQLVSLPRQPRTSDRPEVVLPPKPERPAGAKEDLSPVSSDNLVRHIQVLAGLKSRHVSFPGNKKAEQYITQELKKYGYSPKADAFQTGELTLHNVVSGSSDRARPALLLSAHFDSVAGPKGGPSSQAPGADDNASGVAILLELARIVREHRMQKNVEFAFFNGEEDGMTGSAHLSGEYRDHHWPIDYVINVDTIGTWKGPLSNTCPVNFVTNIDSVEVLRQFAERFPYPLRQAKRMWRDDHASFWNAGFKAIEITEEDGASEDMHKPTDTPEKLDYDNLARIVHGLYVVLSP